MNIIEKYVKDYYKVLSCREMSYSELADILLDAEETNYSHRTLRRKLSEEFNKQLEVKEHASLIGDRIKQYPLTPKECFKGNDFDIDAAKEFLKTHYQWEPSSFTRAGDRDYGYVEQGCGYREYYEPTPKLQPFLNGNPNNVLVIGDTQFPFHREGYLEHCRAVQERFNCGTVVHIGDVAGNHYSSFHETNPDGYGAGEELDRVVAQTKEWARVFPKVLVTIGNHDAIINRQAVKAGISSRWIKGLAEVFETPNWVYDTEFIINGTMYTHTLGSNVLQAALLRQVNLVVGHEHSQAKIEYAASLDKLFWAMKVGAGVDDRKYAFNYAKTAPKKSIMSCGVVEGNVPFIIPMNL